MAIIVKRVSASADKDEEAAPKAEPPAPEATLSTEPEAGDIKVGEAASATTTALGKAGATTAPMSGGVEEEGDAWRALPEIVLFWARNRRRGGTLVVCPDKSMDRLIQAYVVCEVVEASKAKKSM